MNAPRIVTAAQVSQKCAEIQWEVTYVTARSGSVEIYPLCLVFLLPLRLLQQLLLLRLQLHRLRLHLLLEVTMISFFEFFMSSSDISISF